MCVKWILTDQYTDYTLIHILQKNVRCGRDVTIKGHVRNTHFFEISR